MQETKDLETLYSDMLYLINVTEKIDYMYSKQDPKTLQYIKKLRRITDRFNEKYQNLKVVVNKNDRIFLKFLLNRDSVRDTLDKFSASKRRFDYAVKDTQTLHDTLVLKKNLLHNMVEVLYRDDSLKDMNAPEFRIIAMHALQDYDRTVKIEEDDDDIFSFSEGPEEGTGFMYRSYTSSDLITH